eukprot:CAMPEP_0198198928 /NCGR_PEP_ID=MMETSP1445-20131203/2287_1 /TAXON_ID=36898 /ORGANISM="Pyramimonas sp., Strain CCMP2087" /LENGTH=76 /DNA_ID=CAMNT_0043868607 /DNA_START=27 /DNA_END=260 /DNA_ORIENTATION=-
MSMTAGVGTEEGRRVSNGTSRIMEELGLASFTTELLEGGGAVEDSMSPPHRDRELDSPGGQYSRQDSMGLEMMLSS